MSVDTKLVVTTASTWQLDPESTPSQVSTQNGRIFAASASLTPVLAEGNAICHGNVLGIPDSPFLVSVSGLTYNTTFQMVPPVQGIPVLPDSTIQTRINGFIPLTSDREEGTGEIIFVMPGTPPTVMRIDLTVQMLTTGTVYVKVS